MRWESEMRIVTVMVVALLGFAAIGWGAGAVGRRATGRAPDSSLRPRAAIRGRSPRGPGVPPNSATAERSIARKHASQGSYRPKPRRAMRSAGQASS